MNILVTTLGATWQIIPELLGFTNSKEYNFYGDNPEIEAVKTEYNINPVDEVWIITTDSKQLDIGYDKILAWKNSVIKHLQIKFFILKGVSNLKSVNNCRQMGDLIYLQFLLQIDSHFMAQLFQ